VEKSSCWTSGQSGAVPVSRRRRTSKRSTIPNKDDEFAVDETKLPDYLKENDIPWRQVYEDGWMNPVVQQYGIRAISAPWLIDWEGNLITHQARGHDLERLVVEALKDKSAD